MLDETFIALALGLTLFTAVAADPDLLSGPAEPRIVSIADLPTPGPVAAAPDAMHLPLWVAEP